MKKLIYLMMILVLGLSCAALVACGGDDEAKANAELTEGIGNLLIGAASVDCLSTEMTMSGGGMLSTTAKMWLKEGKMRTETNMTGIEAISIMDTETGTSYMITGGIATPMAIPLDTGSPIEKAAAIMSYQPEVVGSDTIDGKKCIIAEYNVAGAKTKMWVWEDNGIPLRMETVAPEGTMVVEYKSVDFDCAADSMFELPEGVPVMDMGEIPGMPDMSDFDMPDMPGIPQQ